MIQDQPERMFELPRREQLRDPIREGIINDRFAAFRAEDRYVNKMEDHVRLLNSLTGQLKAYRVTGGWTFCDILTTGLAAPAANRWIDPRGTLNF